MIKTLKPRKALNKAFLKVKPNRTAIENFKAQLITLLNRTNDTESEEFHRNLVIDFLKKTYYDPQHFINTKGKNDLVIHNGPQADTAVGVIIETKKPTNRAEMISADKLNVKAFQELVLYYLRERITCKNLEIKQLIATNIYEWYIFDATLFDRLFAQNKGLVKQFTDFEAGRMADYKTEFFYKQIAKPFIEGLAAEVECTYVNLLDYEKPLRNPDKEDDAALIALYKLLAPEHLLKLPFANDSNSLDKRFYSELLHIIGLTETKDGGKKIIERHKPGERHSGTLLEDTIIQLDSLDKLNRLEQPGQYGNTQPERLFAVAMELVITWINRILFLKLLEAQLISYHRHTRQTTDRGQSPYAFLNLEKIKNYDDLNSLFFQVLARRHADRSEDVQQIFAEVPYLNSSLFEPTDLEQVALFISNLRGDKTIPLHSQTVLKDEQGKKKTAPMPTLAYLFAFLDAYDFSAEGGEDIQEDNKTLINASVLGLIFEKINGYKDGSYFTPGFVTMYMCRETIQKAVVQKFNAIKGWNCSGLDELYEKIEDRNEANTIINQLKICDPAVGSGHFLVSSLNEVIAIKSDLKILQDRQGRRLKEYQVEVVNDELIVTDENGELFEYHFGNKESQRIQETLFFEKQTIIENCLFGVDINANSVKICRLRLWIELLKSAFYKNATELETLPNIDINIKSGNSLVSRFAIHADLKQALQKSKYTISAYKLAITQYKHATSKEEKWELQRLIDKIKSDFRTYVSRESKDYIELTKLNQDYFKLFEGRLFDQKLSKQQLAEKEKLENRIKLQSKKLEDIKENTVYENAFEWRFEFPEVLNDNGDFEGFDVMIGNPPYIRQEELGWMKEYLKKQYETFAGTADMYVYFVERGMQLLRTGGDFCYILPNKWMKGGYGKALRQWALAWQTHKMVDFGDLPVFDEATTYPSIWLMQKVKATAPGFMAAKVETLEYPEGLPAYLQPKWQQVDAASLQAESWNLVDSRVQKLLDKIKAAGRPLGEYVNGKIYRGVLTGLNEAFVIDAATKDRLIAEDPGSAAIIKPFLAGRDIKRYQQPVSDKYLLLFKNGFTNDRYNPANEQEAWAYIKKDYPAIAAHLLGYAEKARARYDKGQYWWELRACDYYDEFDFKKIVIPAIVKSASYGYDCEGYYSNDKTAIIPTEDLFLLALLNSKVIDFYLKQIASTKQNGYYEYKPVYVSQLPIRVPDIDTHNIISSHVKKIFSENSSSTIKADIEQEIDELIFALYSITDDERIIILNH